MTPLVLLPGMMCDGRLFGPQIAAIGLNRAVHLAPISGHETVEALAAEVLANAPPRFALAGLSMGGIVAIQAVRVGSFDLDAALITWIRREYGIAVGEQTAEEIKITIGSAYPTEEEFQAEVRGRELMSGLPKTVLLSPEEVREALAEPVGAMVDSVITCLGQAPPELAQDLITQGLYLVGGGSMLRGLGRRLALETEVPVRQVEAPLETVVLGAGRVIESYEALQAMFMDARKGV